MSLYLDKRKARRALRHIRKEASGIASAANALGKGMQDFKNDANLDGKAFKSARNHFGYTYYAVLLMAIKAADMLKTNAESYLKALEEPYTLDRAIMDESKLITQRDKMENLVDWYDLAQTLYPESKAAYEKLYNSAKGTLDDYNETIEQMHTRDGATSAFFESASAAMDELAAAVEGIKVGCVKNANGDIVFTNKIKDVDIKSVIDELEKIYMDAKIMKAKFDPVNMATGCYIYDKSFLKTEGVVPLAFES